MFEGEAVPQSPGTATLKLVRNSRERVYSRNVGERDGGAPRPGGPICRFLFLPRDTVISIAPSQTGGPHNAM
jgi:hypothetical protein